MPRGRKPNPNNATPEGADVIEVAPVTVETVTEHVSAKGVRVKVKKDGVWLKDGERAEIGDTGTLPADTAKALKEAGYVELL